MTDKPLKSFTVLGVDTGPLRVTAARFSADAEGVFFFSESHELTASFPPGFWVVSTDAERPLPVPPAEGATPASVELTMGEALFVPGPTIGNVTINVTAGESPRPADIRALLDRMRQDLPVSDRNECLNAILHFVGVLSAPGSRPVAEDLMTISDLATAVSRMKHVAHKRLSE